MATHPNGPLHRNRRLKGAAYHRHHEVDSGDCLAPDCLPSLPIMVLAFKINFYLRMPVVNIQINEAGSITAFTREKIMAEERRGGGRDSDTYRIKKLEVISAIAIAIIAASSGWVVALQPVFGSKDKTGKVERVDGHWEITANGWVFDMCILQDQGTKIKGGMFLRPNFGPAPSTCDNLHDSTDPFRGDFNPATGEISFTRDPDTEMRPSRTLAQSLRFRLPM